MFRVKVIMLRRPELRVALSLIHSRQDHYRLGIVIPNHLPEVKDGGWQRVLCQDELPQSLVAHQPRRVDVVRAFHAWFGGQVYTTVLHRQVVCAAVLLAVDWLDCTDNVEVSWLEMCNQLKSRGSSLS